VELACQPRHLAAVVLLDPLAIEPDTGVSLMRCGPFRVSLRPPCFSTLGLSGKVKPLACQVSIDGRSHAEDFSHLHQCSVRCMKANK